MTSPPGGDSFAIVRRRRTLLSSLGVLLSLLLLLPAGAGATQRLYVANAASQNINGFTIAADGSLTALPGSPYGGAGVARGTVLTPDGAHLYVADANTGKVVGYDVAASGALSPAPGSPYAGVAGGGPQTITISPDGAFLFMTQSVAGKISAYTVAANGALTAVPGSPFATGNSPYGIAMSPDGAQLFTANGSGSVRSYGISATGVLQPTGTTNTGSVPYGVRPSPDGKHLYVPTINSGVRAFDIGSGGALTPIVGAPFAAGTSPEGIALTPNGANAYVTDFNSGNVHAFSVAASGALSAVAGSPFPAAANADAIIATADGKHVYASVGGTTNAVYGYAIGSGGALAQVPGSPFPVGTSPDNQALALAPDTGPTAAFTTAGKNGKLSFDGSGSSDPDGSVAVYDWDFGDGQTLANGGPTPSHDYATAGDYTAKLTVTDDTGCSTTSLYTGQSMLCVAGPRAVVTQQIDSGVVGPKLHAVKSQRPRRQQLFVRIDVRALETVRVKAKGKIVAGKDSFPLAKVQKLCPNGGDKRIDLKLKRPDDVDKVRAAIGGRGVKAKIAVKFTDEAGNAAKKKTKVTLK